MFKDTKFFGSFSVNDVKAARSFYADKLGVEINETMGMLQLKPSGGSMVFVYPKPDHKPATFTVLNFPVDDIAATMDKLREAGVTFEIYTEGDAKTDDQGVSTYGDTKAAWFKDPAGNILALLEGM